MCLKKQHNMKILILAALAFVAIEAVPYGYLPGGVPQPAVFGVGGLGGSRYNSGSSYGNSGYGSGSSGYGSSGYGMGGAGENHNIGHTEDDFNKVVSSHHASDHNIGGSGSYGNSGGQAGGYNNYGQGHSIYGNGYNAGTRYIP